MSSAQSVEDTESKNEKGTKSRIDLDTILIGEVGQCGWFQMRTLFLGWVIVIFGSWGANEYVFTTARINTRCHIPECESSDADYSTGWVLNAIPGNSQTTLDNCQRYSNVTTLPPSDEVCPVNWFDRNTLQDCDSYVYENTLSVAYDFGLACEEWRRALIGTIRNIGTFTALPITGYVSDRWGRRTALALNAFNTGWMGCLRYFSNNYVGFIISEFAESTFGSGAFSTIYILLMEVMGPKYRIMAGASINTMFSVGQVALGLIAWGVPSWRELTLTLYVPQLMTILYFWLMTESVRWYMSKGRYQEAEHVLKTIARVNNKTLSDKSLIAFKQSAEEENRNQSLRKEEKENEPWLIVLLFQHKKVLIRCLASPVWWMTTTFIYYGLSINAVNLVGNRYLNYMAVSAAQIPGYWTAVLLMDIVGRKPVLIVAFWLCASCQIAYIFLPDEQYALSLTLYMVGTYCIAAVMTSIYVYTAELYPTNYRHRLFAFSSMMGRIGSILAPLTPALGAVWDKLPYVLFASFALVSGLLVFVTPETLGSKFPDTMEEASDIGRKRSPRNNSL